MVTVFKVNSEVVAIPKLVVVDWAVDVKVVVMVVIETSVIDWVLIELVIKVVDSLTVVVA